MTESSVFQLDGDPRLLVDWVTECLEGTGERFLSIEWCYARDEEDGPFCLVDTDAQSFILGQLEVVAWDPDNELFVVPDSEHQPVKHHRASSLRKAQNLVDFVEELEEASVVDWDSFLKGQVH